MTTGIRAMTPKMLKEQKIVGVARPEEFKEKIRGDELKEINGSRKQGHFMYLKTLDF